MFPSKYLVIYDLISNKKMLLPLLLQPLPTAAAMIPDSTATYKLFDRVVNIRQGYSVPFGLRGTVVGVHPSEVEMNSVFEVLFDEEFQGAISIRYSHAHY